jgi:NAD(P)-dependent dehydrogenase (short-subunit alcohol dehydrogenase family)
MPETVVITGSTRGLGLGLAGALLQAGARVVVSGRSAEAAAQAETALAGQHGRERVLGFPADVTDFAQVQRLWDAAAARFERVTRWVNNAGLALPDRELWKLDPAQIRAVVDTNLTGLLYGCHVAARGLAAHGGGVIFNLEGFGSTGRTRRGMTTYGSTKAAVAYVTRALAVDLAGTPVKAASLSPGMVMTDMILNEYRGRPAEWKRARRIFNLIAEQVETVTPWLAERVLADPPNGKRFAYLSSGKLTWRFLTAPLSRRDIFAGRREPDEE